MVLWSCDGSKLLLLLPVDGILNSKNTFLQRSRYSRNFRHCHPHLLYHFLLLEVTERRKCAKTAAIVNPPPTHLQPWWKPMCQNEPKVLNCRHTQHFAKPFTGWSRSFHQGILAGNLGTALIQGMHVIQLCIKGSSKKLPAYLCLTETIWHCLIFSWSYCKHLALESMSHRSRL